MLDRLVAVSITEAIADFIDNYNRREFVDAASLYARSAQLITPDGIVGGGSEILKGMINDQDPGTITQSKTIDLTIREDAEQAVVTEKFTLTLSDGTVKHGIAVLYFRVEKESGEPEIYRDITCFYDAIP